MWLVLATEDVPLIEVVDPENVPVKYAPVPVNVGALIVPAGV